MAENTLSGGQPFYSQAINLLSKSIILRISREYGGEREN